MVRWGVLVSVASVGCSLVTTEKLPLVMLAEVPVPASARWTDGDEYEIGGDAGGGLLFLNNQADPTEGLYEALETDEAVAAAEGTLYYEGVEERTFFGLFVFFFESVTFDGRVVRLRTEPPPPAIGVADPVTAVVDPAVGDPSPGEGPEESPRNHAPPDDASPDADVVAPADPPPADEPAVDEAVEVPPVEPKLKKRKKKKRKKRKKRRRKS